MKDRARFRENAKSVIIAVLAVSSMFLFIRAVAFEPESTISSISAMFNGSADSGAAVSSGNESSVLGEEPAFLLVTAADGTHTAVKYDRQRKKDMFSRFSSALGEALGSSGTPIQITEADWRQALLGSGIFFDYLYSQPLSTVAARLGTETSESTSDKSARRLFVSGSGDKLTLYFISGDDGTFFSCETALSSSYLTTKLSDYSQGSASFAFELGSKYESIDPYFVFSREEGKIPGLSASNPMQGSFDVSSLISLFGMNSHTVSEYSEDDGSQVYVEGGRTLRVEPSGRVLFSVTDDSGLPVSDGSGNATLDSCISLCSEIVKSSIGQTSGDGSLGLVGASGASSSAVDITFNYSVGGIPVTLSEATHAADFTISGGSIVRAELFYRNYAFSGSQLRVLPEKQAVEIARSSGGEPVLVYEDSSSGISGTWIIN